MLSITLFFSVQLSSLSSGNSWPCTAQMLPVPIDSAGVTASANQLRVSAGTVPSCSCSTLFMIRTASAVTYTFCTLMFLILGITKAWVAFEATCTQLCVWASRL